MRNKCKFLLSLICMTLFLFNMDDSAVIAAEQNMEAPVGVKAESAVELPVEAEAFAEADDEPAVAVVPSVEVNDEPAVVPSAETETEQAVEASISGEPEQLAVSAAGSDTEQMVSDGSALIEWLESHKDIGGTVKLTDHVVLDDEYSFCPSGINRPSVFVDTDKYTITVTGEIEFLSDNHLLFSGQPEGKGIFYVAGGGMLSLSGVTVESGQCALWQEEGAGLVEEGCHISGRIHYADTPFVVYQNAPCVVVEKGQTLYDVLPAQISCTVNRQGQINSNEWVPLSWNLEGTEKQQAERRRFELQGSFLGAASAKPVQCTVVYNDYPLTFTDVKASISCSMYTFRGWYTMPEGALPITVMSEYSLDCENWIMYEETKVADTYTGFFIAVSSEACDRTTHPYIYIRLRCDDNGTSYFSNVLCYAADNLEHAEDIGGSRGGGTSIVNPPGKPQKNNSDAPSEEEKPVDKEDQLADSGSAGTSSNAASLDTYEGQPAAAKPETVNEEQSSDVEPKTADGGQAMNAELKTADEGQTTNAEPKNANHRQSPLAEVQTASEERPANTELKNDNIVGNSSDRQENVSYSAALPLVKEQPLRSDIRLSSWIIIAAGFVLLSAIAGIAGFFVHSRSGTNR